MAGVVETTNTFATNDVITSTAMNNIIDQTLFTEDAISGGTLAMISGKLKVATSGITSNEMAVNAVTTNTIADLNVTTAKLADNAVTTAKIANLNVTTGKIADLGVTTAKIADSNVTTAKIADANITAAKLSGAQTGSAPIYGARAWVRFNGNNNVSGTPDASNTTRQILASGNVTSVTKSSTGLYVIAFTTALPSANYVAVGSRSYKAADSSSVTIQASSPTSQTSSAFTFYTLDRTGGSTNSDDVQVVIFG